MLLEWLTREGGIVLSWWALVTLAGAAALPLCLRVLGGLPDRGYTLARAAGLLLVGFVFWLLASLGFLHNTAGSMVLAWAIVLVVALAAYFGAGRDKIDLSGWWSENKRVILTGEVLFFVLLFAWSIFRAYQNSLTGTEKPMELAFLSATMRSGIYPPADPWLSGYAISYYYFGYVIMAMLSTLSGVVSTIGFNMTTALLFALTGLSAFGVAYNLVRSRGDSVRRGVALLVGLLAMVFVVLLSNFEMILVEMPYQTATASESYLKFWGMNERMEPIGTEGSSDVNQWGNWWWFRASRALNDLNLDGSRNEVIDEFPGFSFLLSDNHPHVLALPFAVLAVGLALNTLLVKRRPNAGELVFYGVCFGGLIFLNTWDGPVYMILLVAAEGLRRLLQRGSLRRRDWVDLVLLGVTLLVLAAIFYLPFLVAFRSQLAGILPNLQFPTLFQQYFMMFGPFLLILAPFLAVEVWRAGRRINWGFGLKVGLLLLVGLFVLMLVLAALAWLIPSARSAVMSFVEGNGGWPSVFPALLAKRITHLVTALVLTTGIIVIVARLFPRRLEADDGDGGGAEAAGSALAPQTGFALLLVAAAIILTLVPEFVYLRDNFGTRMNTVFKFYYQGWLLFALGSAYAVYSLFAGSRLPSLAVRAAFAALTAAVVVAGLLYPLMGVQARMYVETGRIYALEGNDPTLDGGGSISGQDDYQAALCLSSLVTGTDAVLASAVGGSYQWPSGVISTYSGIPTLFNWGGHEAQWRGGSYGEATGTRESDVDRLYADPTWNTAQSIISKYGIDYIVFGDWERQRYSGSSEIKFRDNLDVACESGETRIYHVPEQILAKAQ